MYGWCALVRAFPFLEPDETGLPAFRAYTPAMRRAWPNQAPCAVGAVRPAGDGGGRQTAPVAREAHRLTPSRSPSGKA